MSLTRRARRRLPRSEGVPIEFAHLRGTGRRNQFAALPRGYQATPGLPHIASPEFAVPVAKLRDAFLETLEGEPRLILTAETDDRLQVEFVQRSRVFRLPDVVTVAFVPLSDCRSTLAIWSRARVGAYDFGVNHRRVRRWLGRLLERMARDVPQS